MSKLGELFIQKRESLKLEILKASDDTRISEDVIRLLEEGAFSKLPSYIHALNFVRQYGSYLGLDEKIIMENFNSECSKSDYERQITYVSSPVTEETSVKIGYGKYIAISIVIAVIAIISAFVYVSMDKNGTDKPIIEERKNVAPEEMKDGALPVENNSLEDAKDETPILNNDKEIITDTEPVKEESDTSKGEVPKDTVKLESVELVFSDACWVHLKIDNDSEMDFIAQKGTSRTVEFKEFFVLDLGNAAVVQVKHTSKTISGLGEYKKPMKGLKFSVSNNKLIYDKN